MSLYLAPCNWNGPDWQRHYYPDDLPPEWRLTYLANQFQAAAISVSELLSLRGLWEEWLDDLEPEFRFVITVTEEEASDWPEVIGFWQERVVLSLQEHSDSRLAGAIAAANTVENGPETDYVDAEGVLRAIHLYGACEPIAIREAMERLMSADASFQLLLMDDAESCSRAKVIQELMGC